MTLPAGLLERPFAHRGLWDAVRPENSLAAFDAACAAGYGVELDVQLSADGEAVVFHDTALDRMTRQSGCLEERTADELAATRLLESDQTIPTLAQALDLIGDRAFLLVEIKAMPGQEGLLEQRVAELLAAHAGPFAVIGFSAASHIWLAQHHPHLPRGHSISHLRDLAPLSQTRPDFLVMAKSLIVLGAAQRRRGDGLPIVAWTIQDEADRRHATAFADNFIFDGLLP